MKYLNRPVSKSDDLKVVTSACHKYSWTERSAKWRKAYKKYYRFLGYPWQVSPMAQSVKNSAEHYALYDTRKLGGPINRIRDTKNLLGSGPINILDVVRP